MADYLQRLVMRGAAGLPAASPRAPQSDPGAIEQHVESIASHAATVADAPADPSPAAELLPVPATPPQRTSEASRLAAPATAPAPAPKSREAMRPPVSMQSGAGSTTRDEPAEVSGTARVAGQPSPKEALVPADGRSSAAATSAASIPSVAITFAAATSPAPLQTVTLARPVPAQVTSPDEDISEPRAAASAAPSVLIGRIDIEVAPPPAAPRPAPVERTRGFASYANSRRGLRD